jgi:two-component system CheB/CheR fusion protein
MKVVSTPKKSPAKKVAKENSFPVVAIGASAGGLEAMMELLKHLPANTGMAFIYVQHLSPDHKSMLTEILSKKTQMKVQEIDDMDLIQPDNVFVIPYNKGIEVTDGHIKLIPRSETSVAISIDILFSSLAQAQKERVIGIILSGSASDGSRGIKDIKHEGGLTFAQDDTAKFTSMPHSAIATGEVDYILSPKEIALELARLSKHPYLSPTLGSKGAGVKSGEENLIENSNPDLIIILNQLHKATGVDFSAYKMTTIKRRIIRRMLLYKIKTLKEYAKLLKQKNEEVDILYQDLLINVTSFFRDTGTHKFLKETLFPKLLKRKKKGESLRIWVPACATGEEAYSIAIMLLEIQGSQTSNIPIQIFATDLSQQAIGKARTGVYTKQELETISPKRIQRFFTKDNGRFLVNKAVRDMCVFAPHNILRDPPFSRLDFISCCNVFIYFDTDAQKKAINTFHYALNDDGFLMLGKSENISQSANLFKAFNKNFKIFSRKINPGTPTRAARLPHYPQQTILETNVPVLKRIMARNKIPVYHNELDDAIDALLVSEFMPASVVINHQLEIVQFRGTTDLFLTHPKGKATFNILKMARPEIAFELRNAISKVIKSKQRVRKSSIELKVNSTVRIISLEVLQLEIEWNEPLLLILFTEQEQTEIYSQQVKGGKDNSLAKDRRIKKLEQELAAAHSDAIAIAQEHEAVTKELQSANEEVVSSNEELQTVNEELETSKEEIESANEELTTTNQELQTRNDLLNEAYGYSEALFATIHESMLVLDKNLRVKSANKTFYKIFNVNEEETEGVLLYDLGNKQWNIPRLRELLEDLLPKNTHFHDFEITHTFPLIGEKTMLLNARRIVQKTIQEELILLAIADITEQATARRKIEESEKRYNMMLMNSPFTFAVLKGKDLIIDLANDRVKEVWGRGNDIEDKSLLKIMPELKDTPFPALFDEVRATGTPFHGVEVQSPKDVHGNLKEEYFNFVFQPYLEADQTISGITIIGNEVTEQVIAKRKIEESEERFRLLADNVPVHIFTIEPDAKATISYRNKNWLNYTGESYEESNGNTWRWVIHPDDVQSIMDEYVSAFEKQQPFFLSALRVRRHDGEYRWHSVQANPRYLPNKEFIGYIGVGFDIHEQKLAQDALKLSEEHFRLMADLMPAKISNASAVGDVTYFNKHWLDFSGYTFEELKEFGYNKMMHPNEVEEFQQRFKKATETGSNLIMEMRFKNKQGQYIWHLNIASPIKDENGILKLWIGVTTEMQHQKEQREGLEDAVAERTVELLSANNELIRMNKELESFTYVSSHDLQEPLRKIRMIAGLILEKENPKLSDSGKNYFRMMQNAAERMQTLIQDLLAFSRLSMADRNFETTDLNSIIEEVKKEFKEAIAEKNAVIEVKEICDVKIIPFQFRQLMQNLIGNALKFSNPNIQPHIKISSVNITSSNKNVVNLTPHKEYCHISISDNGIGFEKEFAEKIFEVFQKLHGKEEYAGTGIGLAIVKKIVDNHNGIITATSKLHRGTTFDIYIPA